MRFSLAELADFLDTTVVPAKGGAGSEAEVNGVAIDSRRVETGSLFVALVAERDGHEFIGAAADAGAVAVLCERAVDATVPTLVVPDSVAALSKIGELARCRVPDRVIGVTGSVGKTSTKDLLASALSGRWRTAASEKSFNNELGLPLTLANAADDAEAIVVEMGARGMGHIAELCRIARPTTGVITAVADAHLAMFGSVAGVARAKSELIEALPSDGVAVLNSDDARVLAMAERTSARVLTYGMGAEAEVRGVDVTLDRLLRPTFELRTPWGEATLSLAVRGRHQAVNSLGAAAAALALGVDFDDVVSGLEGAEISGLRMEVTVSSTGLVVVNDSYNANPTSMRAALESLAALDVTGRKVAILGVMAELGATGPRAHRDIAEWAHAHQIEVVAVAAPDYQAAISVADIDAAIALAAELGDGDAVLVKASRAAGLEAVATSLLADDVG